mgnify:FL=1|tara:strand:+ start:14305 stop:14493 length:189 start_codon:yes stop_codon:yes gene_type:complete
MGVNKKSIKVGIANEGETSFSVETLSKWKPEKINYVGSLVFFSFEGTFFSMNRNDFNELFNN